MDSLVTIAILDLAGPAALAHTLAALARHTSEPHDVALLVADGAAAPERAPSGRPLRIVAAPAPLGAPAALNLLLAAGTAPHVLLLESSATVTAGWLQRLLRALDAPAVGLSGPSTNAAWNEQQVLPRGGGLDWPAAQIDAFAAALVARHGDCYQPLNTLHSLADFCYLFKRSVAERLGGFDESYGPGPCWEIDFTTRAARAGFGAVWVMGAYVHRGPQPLARAQLTRQLFVTSKHLYQDRFCGLRLRDEATSYEPHCRGEACEHFAPPDLIRLDLGAPRQPPATAAHVALRPPPATTPDAAPRESPATAPDTVPRQPPAATAALPTLPAEAPPLPLVSCIMPTRNRPDFVAQAIRYFERQDYPNRELIVVDDGDESVAHLIPAGGRIQYVAVPGRQAIGVKRNLACELAQGAIIAHWDDDDWYAADRLTRQTAPLVAGTADVTGLAAGCFFDLDRWQAWTITPELHRRLFVHDVHGGTLVFWRRIWERLARYPAISVAEDALFLRQACRAGARLEKLANGGTFVYLRHGANAWRFPLGTYVDPAGWQPVDAESALPAGDRPFYAAHCPAAPARAPEQPIAPRTVLLRRSLLTLDYPTERSEYQERPPAAPALLGREREPLVTCIMPTADRRRFVAQAIYYFLRQDYERRELLILDDGSDPIGDLVPADARIQYVPLDRRLVLGVKRNLACELAAGDLIAHWDDDDWIAPQRLGLQVAALQRARADLCGASRQLYYDPAGERAWLYQYPPSRGRWLAGNTLCYRREFWEQNRFPEIGVGEDTRFLWRAGEANGVVLPEHDCVVGVVHARNTSPKATTGPYWLPRPVEDAHRLLRPDLAFYKNLVQSERLVDQVSGRSLVGAGFMPARGRQAAAPGVPNA
ncbi:MAG TPA: glycosyltransferase [Chloroflexota bacterium]|jgi:glycosyltransferase involved in cell wall biosynthesis